MMAKLILSLILSVGLVSGMMGCLPKAPLTEAQKAEHIYDKAIELQVSEEHEEAITEFQDFVGKYPQSDDADNAQLNIGNSLHAQGKYQEAVFAYQSVVEEYPQSDSADISQLTIGDIYLALGEQDEAVKAYKQLLEKYPYLSVGTARLAQERLNNIEFLNKLAEELEAADEKTKDNSQYAIATLFLEAFSDYKGARKEFQKLIDRYPDSELADDALFMIGECYFKEAGQKELPQKLSDKGEAFTRLAHIMDRYPQFASLERYDTDGYPHWPAGRRGDRYEMYFAEVNRILEVHPNLKEMNYKDFLPVNYSKSLQTWEEVLLRYPNTDTAKHLPQLIAQRSLQLGTLYYNMHQGGSLTDFSSILFKASLEFSPTAEAHIALASYYADVSIYARWTYYNTRVFEHLKAAKSLVPTESDLASEIKALETWMNYRRRLEALENQLRRR